MAEGKNTEESEEIVEVKIAKAYFLGLSDSYVLKNHKKGEMLDKALENHEKFSKALQKGIKK